MPLQRDPQEDAELQGSTALQDSTIRLNDDNDNDDFDTKKSSSGHVSESAHMKSTIALCMCVLTHSYLLISVFPYSGFLAIDLIEGADEDNAGSYSGMIASAFMFGRAVSSFTWGKVADVYGRTFVLNMSLGCSCVLSILFGVSRTFAWALTVRCLLGLVNGIIVAAKTSVSELACGNSKLETRGMGIVMGMWGWGFLVSPAISGALSRPARQYPDNPVVERFHGILSRYPFILPNLFGAVFCILAMATVNAWVHETLPQEKRRHPMMIPSDFVHWLRTLYRNCFQDADASREEMLPILSSSVIQYSDNTQRNDCDDEEEIKDVSMAHSESCSFLSTDATIVSSPRISISPAKNSPKRQSISSNISISSSKATMKTLMKRQNTRRHLICYWIYSFASISVDEAFPLFCISKGSGLGTSEAEIGKILSGSGLIFAVSQYFLYTTIVHHTGLYPSMYIGSGVGGPLMCLVPLALVFNHGLTDGEISWSTYIFLSFMMAIKRVFGSVFFSSISIAMNKTVPVSQRARMNGLCMLGGSIAKAIGPLFTGYLVSFSFSSGVFPPQVGAYFVFAIMGLLGLAVFVGGYIYLEEDNCDDTLENEELDKPTDSNEQRTGQTHEQPLSAMVNGNVTSKSEELGATTLHIEHDTAQQIDTPSFAMVNSDNKFKNEETGTTAYSNERNITHKKERRKKRDKKSPNKLKTKPQDQNVPEQEQHQSNVGGFMPAEDRLEKREDLIENEEVSTKVAEGQATQQQQRVVSIHDEQSTCSSPHVDLSGDWSLVVSKEFRTEYDQYLKGLSQSYLVRSMACSVLGMTTEETRQSDSGNKLLIRSRNARGVWERTLSSSSSFGENDEFVPIPVPVVTADSEVVNSESWWEEGGTVHRSWLRGGTKYGGGDFESKRYLQEDGKVLVCESVFHPHDERKPKACIKWKFLRNEPEPVD